MHRIPHPRNARGPHDVEVVRVGDEAMVVCHDCRSDTGVLLVPREAEALAWGHRAQTRGASVPMPGGVPR
jgi:hypothetical protein